CSIALKSVRRVGAGHRPGYARPPILCDNSYIWRIKMPKLKTKSSVKKRFRLTATGKVRRQQAGKQHGMIKRTNKQIREHRGSKIMSDADAKFIKKFMPYG
ncbi:uncharacterized protein METZ01_LOCUS331952, partial [marine metagenome]